MSVTESLLRVPQREIGGSTALARLDYQTCWGACRIAEHYRNGSTFQVGFEYHDDIVEVLVRVDGETVRFIQVKTHNKPKWTVGQLLELKGNQSMLAKLASNHEKFADKCSGIFLVSNARFDLFADGVSSGSFSSIKKEIKKKIISAVRKELPSISDRAFERLEFLISESSLENYELIARARITELVETKYPGIRFNPGAFARLFIDECRSRSKKILSQLADTEELLKGKFISNANVDEWLFHVRRQSEEKPLLQNAMSFCMHNRHDDLRRNWERYELRTLDPDDLVAADIKDTIRKLLKAPRLERFDSVPCLIEYLFSFLVDTLNTRRPGVPEGLLITATVYEYMRVDDLDETNRVFQEVDKKYTAEKV